MCGGAATLTELIEACRGSVSSLPADCQASTRQAWGAVADHLERVAGHHVRAVATLGGHFALCRCEACVNNLARAASSRLACTAAAAGRPVSIGLHFSARFQTAKL